MGKIKGSPDGDKNFQVNFNIERSQNDFKTVRNHLCLGETVPLPVARNRRAVKTEETGVI